MSTAVYHVVTVAAGLALLNAGFVVFPKGRLDLVKGLTLAVSLSVFAAVLVSAARDLNP